MALLPTCQSPFVSTGLWTDTSEPPYRRWTWTLTNMNALIVLGALMVFSTWAETRAWVLLRYIIARITTPIRLPSESDPIPTLSQTEALLALTKSARRRLHRKRRLQDVEREQESVTTSPWFGIWCLINGSLFLVLGIFIPWFLAEGLQGEPIVRSHIPIRCFYDPIGVKNSEASYHENCRWYWDFAKLKYQWNCLQMTLAAPEFRQIQNRLEPFNNSQYQFLSDYGDNRTLPERFLQRIALRDIGILGDDRMGLYHELTCKPFLLDRFIRGSLWNYYLDSTLPAVNETGYPNWHDQFSSIIELSSSNGPGSGREVFQPGAPFDVEISPAIKIYDQPTDSDMLDFIIRGLLDTFLVVFRAKGTRYSHYMDDPFFSAHSDIELLDGRLGGFIADREITALGCVEFFDICLTSNSTDYCYSREEIRHRVKNTTYTRETRERGEPDWIALLSQASPFLSLGYNLQLDPGLSFARYSGDNYDQAFMEEAGSWKRQVAGWFNQSIFRAQLGFKTAAENFVCNTTFDNGGEETRPGGDEYCNAILFHNIDYTNINFIGFFAVFWAFVSICSLSYIPITFVEKIWAIVGKIWTMIKELFGSAQEYAWKYFEKSTEFSRMVRHHLSSLAVIPTALRSSRRAPHDGRQGSGRPLHHLGSLSTPSTSVEEELDDPI